MNQKERFLPVMKHPGFTLVELMIVIVLLAIMVALAVPVYLSSESIARRNTCWNNQRAMESALIYWRFQRAETNADEGFVTSSCLPGDGEAFVDLNGNVPGDPSRSLTSFFKHKAVFDCGANGSGVGQTAGCDYITDGITFACLTDNKIALKSDGTPFLHDRPVSVNWDHVPGLSGPGNVITALFRAGEAVGWNVTKGTDWEARAGSYGFYRDNGGERRSFWGDESWTDYTMSLDAVLSQGNGYGVYFRTTNDKTMDGYCFQYDPGYGGFVVRPQSGGAEKGPIAVYKAPAGYQWLDQKRHLEIAVRGNQYTIKVDGQQVISFKDDTYLKGKVGLRGWDNSKAQFENVTVTKG